MPAQLRFPLKGCCQDETHGPESSVSCNGFALVLLHWVPIHTGVNGILMTHHM